MNLQRLKRYYDDPQQFWGSFIIWRFMFYIPIQALSLNQALGGGRRFKSKLYRDFEPVVKQYLATLHLPKVNPNEPFYLYFEFGLPRVQDLSNSIKIFEDLMADHLGVNDRDVMAIYCRKIKSAKKDCYIKFNIFHSEHQLIQSVLSE